MVTRREAAMQFVPRDIFSTVSWTSCLGTNVERDGARTSPSYHDGGVAAVRGRSPRVSIGDLPKIDGKARISLPSDGIKTRFHSLDPP